MGLLVGSASARVKREVRKGLVDGSLDIVIGTHALIQDKVKIPKLAVAVVDEQHRFGVLQRAALKDSSDHNPHLLVMSATPIPRTLAMTLYGDLNISTIDELPPGREPVRTGWVPSYKRNDAYRFVSQEVQEGRQAFVVCPSSMSRSRWRPERLPWSTSGCPSRCFQTCALVCSTVACGPQLRKK